MDINHPLYKKIDNTYERVMNEINKFEKVFKQDGNLEKAVMELGGDVSELSDVRQALSDAYDALEGAHYGTLGGYDDSTGRKDPPGTDESVIKEGVLDSDDEDGFMARSQLYFMARDAIKLHGVIQDQDNLEPWVQNKIASSSKDMDAVRRYTEYNAMKAEIEPDGMELSTHTHDEPEEITAEIPAEIPNESLEEGMDFDDKRDDGLQVIAKDMFKHALANAKKKHKESKVAEGVTISGATPNTGNPHQDQTVTTVPGGTGSTVTGATPKSTPPPKVAKKKIKKPIHKNAKKKNSWKQNLNKSVVGKEIAKNITKVQKLKHNLGGTDTIPEEVKV